MNLRPLQINGKSNTYYGTFTYPLLRSRSDNITLDGGFNYIDSSVITLFNLPIYTDHLRTIKFGGSYDFADRWRGSNSLGLHAEQGLPIIGATNDVHSFTTSRFGGRGVFTRFMVQTSRYQPLFGRYSLFALATGQYALNPLLSSSQFNFGGSQLGRGYDSAELIGDRGASASVELRMDMAPGWFLMQAVEPYVFYDAGVIWNLKNVQGIKMKQSATSTGVGTRFVFTKNLTGNVMFAQPLTKTIAAEEILGRGRKPRVFFSLVASL